jgi:hypothetical protein
MANDVTIRVEGLREYSKALRDIDKSLGPELRKGLNEVANIVVDAARPLVPRRTGAAAESIKAGSTARGAAIKVGGNKAPYYQWLDFGGAVGRNKSVKRPFFQGGRYIYPTLARKRSEAVEKLEEVLGRLARENGF